MDMATDTNTNINIKMDTTRIDIHNHLLPAVDDGFKLREDALRAIKRLADAGYGTLCLTPHINPDIYTENKEKRIKDLYDEFIKEIPPEWGIKTHLGGEYMVVNGFEERAGEELLSYPDGSVLIEMSYYYRSENLENAVFELVMEGKTPVLAHPERYLYMADTLKDFDKLKDMGCRMQMNIMSLSGCYGKASLTILDYLIHNRFYDFSATDLHSEAQIDTLLGIKIRKKWRKEVERLSDNASILFQGQGAE